MPHVLYYGFHIVSVVIITWIFSHTRSTLLCVHEPFLTLVEKDSCTCNDDNTITWICMDKDSPGRVAQSVTCLATDACLTADPGIASSIPARSHTFVEIDHEIISTVILLLPLIYSRRVVVSYKRKYVHELLVNRLFKPAQEKSG